MSSLNKLLLSISAIFSAILGIFLLGKNAEKKQKENDSNKNRIKSIYEYLEEKRRINQLTDTDLDKRLRK